ncbi:SsgA family sporulation/cell division regulator [Streptomyces luteolus]|uniref:SsgA family sporulation/cell division regulator n=1 Tax=Streptomyces luteolus TaxID=3043615 RepID=A0ABT6SYJ3_9ACTN|nr:SsgA family sporulation/cell division regulator [Streptomyces sp. B-S-A12]MDI3420678.1 SsgA family sporulation/cell division regulator [Streptomyces sp. B-S-A12]
MIPSEYRGNEKLDAVAKGAISQGAELVPCDVHLRFSANNPYVVTVSTSAPDTDSSKWRLSRDLLSAGLTGAAGIGAVAVEPEAFDGLDLQVRIRVRELDGETLLHVDHRALLQYLEYTHALVPFGSEAILGGIDDALDNALDRILDED